MKEKIADLPRAPGCYLYENAQGEIIYIGKAKSLRDRVRSYFSQKHFGKTARLVHEIADLRIIQTQSETDALLLECRLIKQHRPRFNRIMVEDARFAYIRIDLSEEYPSLCIVRRKEEDDNYYIGCFYTPSTALRALDAMQAIWRTPDCNRPRLSGKQEDGRSATLCAGQFTGYCMAPCKRAIRPEEYRAVIEEIVGYFSENKAAGERRIEDTLGYYQERMRECSRELRFEEAQEYLYAIEEVRHFAARSKRLQVDVRGYDYIVLYRAFREDGYTIFFLRDGEIRHRLRIPVAQVPAYREMLAFLREIRAGHFSDCTDVSVRCLLETMADKYFLPLDISRDFRAVAKELRADMRDFLFN